MKREILVVALGVMLGAGAFYYINRSSQPGTFLAADQSVAASIDTMRSTASVNAGTSAARFLAITERAAALSDVAALRLEIEQRAAEPVSFRRTVELSVLLNRLAELDPQLAIHVAESLNMDARAIEQLRRIWVDGDPDAVLGEARRVAPRELP